MSTLELQLQNAGLQVVDRCERLTSYSADLLENSPLLEDFTPEEADVLAASMLLVRAAPGQVLIREGDAGDWMMLILKGTVDVTKRVERQSDSNPDRHPEHWPEHGPEHQPEHHLEHGPAEPPSPFSAPFSAPFSSLSASPPASTGLTSANRVDGVDWADATQSRVAVLQRGGSLGEMSMLDNGLRFATATAIEPVEAGILGTRAIGLLIRDHPAVGAKLLVKITQLMAQRLRNISNQLVKMLEQRA